MPQRKPRATRHAFEVIPSSWRAESYIPPQTAKHKKCGNRIVSIHGAPDWFFQPRLRASDDGIQLAIDPLGFGSRANSGGPRTQPIRCPFSADEFFRGRGNSG